MKEMYYAWYYDGVCDIKKVKILKETTVFVQLTGDDHGRHRNHKKTDHHIYCDTFQEAKSFLQEIIGYRIDMAGRDVRQARNILERVDALEDTKD